MKICKNCKNAIPEGMKLCPHCEKLPPQLFPIFYVYVLLTLVAFAAAAYFRPFANELMLQKVSAVILWVAFVIFIIFGLLFIFVSTAVLRDCRRVPHSERLTRQETARYKNMRKHISAGRHYYTDSEYCNVCGRRHKK